MSVAFADKYLGTFTVKCAILIALTAFISTTATAAPAEAKFSSVENCQLLGKVEGASGYGKNNGWQPLARHSVLRLADRLGATHVVLERMVPYGAFNGIAVARAYKCGI